MSFVADQLARLAGMPKPAALVRATGPFVERPLAGVPLVVGGVNGDLLAAMRTLGAEPMSGDGPVKVAAFDATGLATPTDLRQLYAFFHPLVRRLAPGARLLVVAPADPRGPDGAATARGIEGFVRAMAKEVGRKGATANLLYSLPGARDQVVGPVRFLASDHSAYVSGQALRVSTAVRAREPKARPLVGKRALVTGAARGLGAATAQRLREEGADVVTLDIPGHGADLEVDIAAPDTPARVAEAGPFDIVVHNAGITRDKTLGNMSAAQWDQLMDVNLLAIIAIDKALVSTGRLREDGRLVYLSSVSGIAGNAGQTNYSAAKAALIGYAQAQAAALAPRGITANAVAPGFIETPMSAKMPAMLREMAKRTNSLGQAGQPRDVAEAIAFLACPDAGGLTGQTLRVCGQALIGA